MAKTNDRVLTEFKEDLQNTSKYYHGDLIDEYFGEYPHLKPEFNKIIKQLKLPKFRQLPTLFKLRD